jgi:hypothetical protein
MMRAPKVSSQNGIPAGADAGFALVDALVSLILVAMILALLPGSVETGKRAWQAAISQDGSNERAAALSMLAQRLESALPVFERDADGLAQIAFLGGPESVTFVAGLSDGPMRGGLYRLTLQAQQAGSARRRSLMLMLSPFQRQDSDATFAPVDHAVIDNIETASFRYFGPVDTNSEPAWHTTWTRTDQLPLHRRQQSVRVAFRARAAS